MKLNNITDFKLITKRDSLNLFQIGKYAGGTVAATGVVVASVITMGGAPAVASTLGSMGLLGTASTGTLISSLSGAALTNASLAAIGGSMAAGTVTITACSSALGGILGGVITNKYISEDPSFNITQSKKVNRKKNVIFINGFLQEKDIDFHDWLNQQKKIDDNVNVFGVNWSSKTNIDIANMISTPGSWSTLQTIVIGAAKKVGVRLLQI